MHFTVTADAFFGLTQVDGPINRGEGLTTISLWYLVNQSIINIMYELSEASLVKEYYVY